MRWENDRKSENVEDRRGMGASRRVIGGGIGTIIIVLVALYFGIDPSTLLDVRTTTDVSAPSSASRQRPAGEDRLADFVSVVLADTEDTWHELFRRSGKEYREPKLVLFSGEVGSACGFAQSAVGPFYCPRDQKVYIDLQFYRDLEDRFQAPGEFAQAYVVAHEIGHHLIVWIAGTSNNATTTANCGTWANATLGAPTEQFDSTNTSGLGGGHCVATSTGPATAGAIGSTTMTLSVTTYKGLIILAINDAPAASCTDHSMMGFHGCF